jgi:hypothetical protein
MKILQKAVLMKIIIAIAFCVCMTACTAGGNLRMGLQIAQTMNPQDLPAALAMARAANDTDAIACYSDLIAYAATLPTLNSATQPITGGFVLLEQARILANNASAVIPAQLHKDCAVLRIDALDLVNSFGLKAGALALPIKP